MKNSFMKSIIVLSITIFVFFGAKDCFAVEINTNKFLTGKDSEPINKLVISKENMEDKDKIIKAISSNQDVIYEAEDFPNINEEINVLNNKIAKDILSIKADISKVVEKKKAFIELNDIEQMHEQIAAKKRSKIDIKTEVGKNLENINLKGLYIVAYKYKNRYDKKSDLTKKVQEFITPMAVSDLRGIFIESYTEVKDYIIVVDKIDATTKGVMKIDDNFINKSNADKKLYVYMSKVSVSPLEHQIKNNVFKSKTEEESNYIILNPFVDKDYKVKLGKFGVEDSIIKNIEKKVNDKEDIITEQNKTQIKNEKDQIISGIRQLNEIDKQMEKLSNGIDAKQKKINELCQDIGFDKTDIKQAIKYLDGKINKLRNKLYRTKEKELIEETTSLVAEGDPREEIAKKVVFLINRMKRTYQKVDRFFSKEEIENYMLIKQDIKRNSTIYREIVKVWIFIDPDKNDKWNVKIISKFKLTDHKIMTEEEPVYLVEEEPVSDIIPDEIPEESNGFIWLWLLLGLPIVIFAIIKNPKNSHTKRSKKSYFGNVFKITGTSVFILKGNKGSNIQCGRVGNAQNNLSFNFPDISRKHFCFNIDSDSNLNIIDNGSSVGTFINNKKLVPDEAQILEENAVLQIADFLKFKHMKDSNDNSVFKIIPLTDDEKEELDDEVVQTYPEKKSAIIILKDEMDLTPFVDSETKVKLTENGITIESKSTNLSDNDIIM